MAAQERGGADRAALYAARTGLMCQSCHFDPNGGGPRNFYGQTYNNIYFGTNGIDTGPLHVPSSFDIGGNGVVALSDGSVQQLDDSRLVRTLLSYDPARETDGAMPIRATARIRKRAKIGFFIFPPIHNRKG